MSSTRNICIVYIHISSPVFLTLPFSAILCDLPQNTYPHSGQSYCGWWRCEMINLNTRRCTSSIQQNDQFAILVCPYLFSTNTFLHMFYYCRLEVVIRPIFERYSRYERRVHTGIDRGLLTYVAGWRQERFSVRSFTERIQSRYIQC